MSVFDRFPNAYKEMLALYEVLRRLGFSPDEINPTGDGKGGLGVELLVGETVARFKTGQLPEGMPAEESQKLFEEIIALWNEGASVEDAKDLFLKSMPGRDPGGILNLAIVLTQLGFQVPIAQPGHPEENAAIRMIVESTKREMEERTRERLRVAAENFQAN